MLFLGQHPAFIEDSLNQLNREADQLLECLPAIHSPVKLAAGQRLFSHHPREGLYLVRQGLLFSELEGRATYVLQPGDVAGLEQTGAAHPADYFGEESVELSHFNPGEWHTLLQTDVMVHDQWQRYLIARNNLFSLAFGEAIRDQQRPQASFLRFKAGERILHEGEDGDQVFTLMRGVAQVLHSNAPVGEIKEGEIFGAIAALTGAPRNATILASTDCTVMAIPKNQFSGLLRSHPETGLHLIKSMARTLNDLNQRIVDGSGGISPYG